MPSTILTSYLLLLHSQQDSDQRIGQLFPINSDHIPTTGAACKTRFSEFGRQPHRFQLLPLWRE